MEQSIPTADDGTYVSELFIGARMWMQTMDELQQRIDGAELLAGATPTYIEAAIAASAEATTVFANSRHLLSCIAGAGEASRINMTRPPIVRSERPAAGRGL